MVNGQNPAYNGRRLVLERAASRDQLIAFSAIRGTAETTLRDPLSDRSQKTAHGFRSGTARIEHEATQIATIRHAPFCDPRRYRLVVVVGVSGPCLRQNPMGGAPKQHRAPWAKAASRSPPRLRRR